MSETIGPNLGLETQMIPVGYMLKRIPLRPEWLQAQNVVDIFSVAGCTTNNFADYIPFWRHNGYWLFNSPSDIEEVAQENSIDIEGTTLFYYEAYGLQFDFVDDDKGAWTAFHCVPDWKTDVVIPRERTLAGFDVVEFVCGNSPEDSLASCCNTIASVCTLNAHCLFDTFEEAKKALESGLFHDQEPGPYRIFAVYVVP